MQSPWLEDRFFRAGGDVTCQLSMVKRSIIHLHDNSHKSLKWYSRKKISWFSPELLWVLSFHWKPNLFCEKNKTKQNNCCEKISKTWHFLANSIWPSKNNKPGGLMKNRDKHTLKNSFVTFLELQFCVSLSHLSRFPCLVSGWRPSLCHWFSLRQVLCLLQYRWRTRGHSPTCLWS